MNKMRTTYKFEWENNGRIEDNLKYSKAEKSELKVVQVRIKNVEYVLLQDRMEFMHREILRRELTKVQAEHDLVRFDEPYRTDDGLGPLLEGPEYLVRGMGHVKIDTKVRTAEFMRFSTDYRLTLDKEKLEEVLAQTFPSWAYSIEIEKNLPKQRPGKPY
jgi:hypothetical protein